jgi:hypothetical protein
MKISKFPVLMTLLCIFVTNASLEAQKIKVLVLGALNGKPHEGVEVYSLCEDGGSESSARRTKTDANGLAEVPFNCASGVKFKVSTYIEGDKLSECGEMEGRTLQEILEVGIISDPRAAGGIWCPAKISKKMKPVPGEVILFVKRPTWWQAHVAP